MGEYDLSDELIEKERQMMEGIMPISIGALILPMLWGPAHGIWITILYYPAWMFVDNLIYNTVHMPTIQNIIMTAIVVAVMILVSLVFARLANPQAAHRAAAQGKTKEQYIKSERIWTIASIIVAIIAIVLATYYNLNIRPFM